MAANAWITEFLERTAGSGAVTFEAVQWRGRRALARQPLPSRRNEDWRFTDHPGSLKALDSGAADGQVEATERDYPAAIPIADSADAFASSGWPAPCGCGSTVAAMTLAGQDPLPAGLTRLSGEELQPGLGHTTWPACGCEPALARGVSTRPALATAWPWRSARVR